MVLFFLYIRVKITQMGFKEELQTLTKSYNSPKLEKVKEILRKQASEGKNSITLQQHQYDKWVVNWLKAQGLNTKTISDQREGTYLTVSW